MIVEFSGVKINVRQWGSPSATRGTIALHGFTGSGEDFAALADRLGCPFVAIDFVGHGSSDSPANTEPYTINFAMDIVAEVVRRLGWKSVDLLGYSMGGRVALSIFAQNPDWLLSLTVVGAHAGIEDESERKKRAAHDELLASRILEIGVDQFSDEWEQVPILLSQARIPEPVLSGLRSRRRENDSNGLASSLRGMGSGVMPPVWQSLKESSAPAVFVTGSMDHKFTLLAVELVKSVQSGRRVTLEGAGHTAHLERPDDFLRLMRSIVNPRK